MTLKKLLLATLLLTIFSTSLLAQTEEKSSATDSTKKYEWDWEWEDIRFDDWELRGSPTISAVYGLSFQRLKDLNGSFEKPNMFEVKLGYTSEKPSKHSEDILKYRFRNIFLSNISTDLSDVKSGATGYESSAWRFGLGWSDGYGYKIGSAAIVPYYSGSLTWTRLDVKTVPADSVDAARLDLFNETFRFGTSAEGGIRFRLIPNFTIEAGYERAAVFQRHLFWKWAGSALIESAAHGLLDSFIGKILRSSPDVVPIVNFVLKNALAYGIYELRTEKMNWPFASETPLTYDQFKFGITFTF